MQDDIALIDQIDALARDTVALRAFLGALELEEAARLVSDLQDRAQDLGEALAE